MGGGEDEEEGAMSVAGESAREFSDEDEPVGPTLKDHPILARAVHRSGIVHYVLLRCEAYSGEPLPSVPMP